MRAVIFASWRGVRPRQEGSAAEYAQEVRRYWAKQVGRGLCSKPKWRVNDDGTGYWYVTGALEDLLLLSATNTARWHALQGPFLLDGFEENFYVVGARKADQPMEALLREGNLI